MMTQKSAFSPFKLSFLLLMFFCINLRAQTEQMGGVPAEFSGIVEANGQVYCAVHTKVYRYNETTEDWTSSGHAILNADDEPEYIQELFSIDDILYATVFNEGIFRSDDGANSWTRVGNIFQIGVTPVYAEWVEEEVIYMWHQRQLLVSEDGGLSFFARLWLGQTLSDRLGGCTTLDGTSYCFTRAIGSPKLLTSTDHFETFTETNLPFAGEYPNQALTFQGNLLCLTEQLYRSDDAAQSWEAVTLPDPAMNDAPRVLQLKVLGDSLFLLTDAGFYKTGDPNLENWEEVPLDIPYLLEREEANFDFYQASGEMWLTQSALWKNVDGDWEEQISGIHNGPVFRLTHDQGRMWANNNGGTYWSDNSGRDFQLIRLAFLEEEFEGHWELQSMRFRRINGVDYCLSRRGMFRSTDNWESWTAPLSGNLRDVQLFNDTLWALSIQSLDYSVDNGETWTSHINSFGAPGGDYALDFHKSDEHVTIFISEFIVNNSGQILHSSDNGINYETVWPEGYKTFAHLGDTLISDGGYLNFVVSFDAGASWESRPIPSQGTSISGLSLDPQGRIVATTNRGLYVSTDWGENWLSFYPDVYGQQSFWDAAYVNGDHLVFSDFDGVLRISDAVLECLFDPLSIGDCGLVSGQVFMDANENCTPDTLEVGLANRIIQVMPDDVFLVTDAQGRFTASLSEGSYELRTYLPDGFYWETICPEELFYEIDLPEDSLQAVDLRYGMYQPPNIQDLVVNVVQTGGARLNEPTYFTLICQNQGTVDLPVELSFSYPDELTFEQASILPTGFAGNSISWDLPDTLRTGESVYLQLVFSVVNDINVLGDTVGVVFVADPIASDITPSDNIAELEFMLVGAYDPNDKQVVPQGRGEDGEIGPHEDEFTYTIRFQNTGNSFARRVELLDTLSADFDLLSVNMIAASHPYEFNIKEGRVLQWEFNGINLPDSTTNERESHGFVRFSVRPQDSLQIGQVLTNRAGIYFDANPVILTNTVRNTVVDDIVTTTEPTAQCVFRWFPNPARDRVTIGVVSAGKMEGSWTAQLYNSLGQLIFTKQLQSFPEEVYLDRHRIGPGVYHWVLYDGQRQRQTGSLILLPD